MTIELWFCSPVPNSLRPASFEAECEGRSNDLERKSGIHVSLLCLQYVYFRAFKLGAEVKTHVHRTPFTPSIGYQVIGVGTPHS